MKWKRQFRAPRGRRSGTGNETKGPPPHPSPFFLCVSPARPCIVHSSLLRRSKRITGVTGVSETSSVCSVVRFARCIFVGKESARARTHARVRTQRNARAITCAYTHARAGDARTNISAARVKQTHAHKHTDACSPAAYTPSLYFVSRRVYRGPVHLAMCIYCHSMKRCIQSLISAAFLFVGRVAVHL